MEALKPFGGGKVLDHRHPIAATSGNVNSSSLMEVGQMTLQSVSFAAGSHHQCDQKKIAKCL